GLRRAPRRRRSPGVRRAGRRRPDRCRQADRPHRPAGRQRGRTGGPVPRAHRRHRARDRPRRPDQRARERGLRMTTAAAPPTFDVTSTPPVPFGRLVRVELRKLADTRAGRWLLISIVALTLLVLIIQLAVVLGNDLHPKFVDFLQGMNTPMAILLPVLGVLSITSEWSQRTAMVTFTLEPSRMRVVTAKLVSLVIVSVLALVVGLVLGAVANVLYGSFSGDDLVWGNVGKLVLTY